MALLEVSRLCRDFGGLRAVADLSFEVRQGEILGLIGPNGAGKTTVFNLITGFIRPSAGTRVVASMEFAGGNFLGWGNFLFQPSHGGTLCPARLGRALARAPGAERCTGDL